VRRFLEDLGAGAKRPNSLIALVSWPACRLDRRSPLLLPISRPCKTSINTLIRLAGLASFASGTQAESTARKQPPGVILFRRFAFTGQPFLCAPL